MRKLAVGKLLGVGHIALWVYAIYAAAWHLAWGRSLLAGAHHLSPVSGTTAASLRENGIVHGSVSWLSHLPWADNGNTYFLLAVACLVIRLRRAPGWLSLAVALPAAVYGLLRALTYVPELAFYWPVAAVALIVAWLIVAKTLHRY
jgi:hypothetical protein